MTKQKGVHFEILGVELCKTSNQKVGPGITESDIEDVIMPSTLPLAGES
jgi:hypothetical protein